MRMWSLGLAGLLLLAGCAGPAAKKGEADPIDFSELDLETTATTGIIRGVVVDDAIRPLPGATVSLRGAEGLSRQTSDSGAFGFDGLEPGAYFLDVSKPGYLPVQQSVDVVAGVAEPPIAKVLLAVDASFVAPFYNQFVFDGFMECGVTTPAVAGAVCSFANGPLCEPPFPPEACTGNVTNDKFNQYIPLTEVPQFIQHELTWEATQTTGNMFNLAARWRLDDGEWGEIKGAIGVSPVILPLNATEIEDEELGLNGTGLAPAVFSGGMEGTEPCGIPIFGCLFPTGATIQQSFRLYTTIFYGYAPPEGWTFVATGEVPPA